MAGRPIPLADWLVHLLGDRRQRTAQLQGIPAEELTGWVFPNSRGDLRETNNMRRDWRAFRNRYKLGRWWAAWESHLEFKGYDSNAARHLGTPLRSC